MSNRSLDEWFYRIFDILGKSAENWAFSDLGLLQFVAIRSQKSNLYMDIWSVQNYYFHPVKY